MTSAENLQDGPILVAVDFSEDSEHALQWAVEHAARGQEPITVLHVVHDPAYAQGYYTETAQQGQVQTLETVARGYLDDFMKRFEREHAMPAGAPPLTPMLTVGLPATRILEVADKIHARLIVVGCRGRTGLARFFLGSKAERVVQLSRIPVTVVKSPISADS